MDDVLTMQPVEEPELAAVEGGSGLFNDDGCTPDLWKLVVEALHIRPAAGPQK